jgi:hypothetical protein
MTCNSFAAVRRSPRSVAVCCSAAASICKGDAQAPPCCYGCRSECSDDARCDGKFVHALALSTNNWRDRAWSQGGAKRCTPVYAFLRPRVGAAHAPVVTGSSGGCACCYYADQLFHPKDTIPWLGWFGLARWYGAVCNMTSSPLSSLANEAVFGRMHASH